MRGYSGTKQIAGLAGPRVPEIGKGMRTPRLSGISRGTLVNTKAHGFPKLKKMTIGSMMNFGKTR